MNQNPKIALVLDKLILNVYEYLIPRHSSKKEKRMWGIWPNRQQLYAQVLGIRKCDIGIRIVESLKYNLNIYGYLIYLKEGQCR